MIFVIAFGIANCLKDEETDYTDTGFCSYETNTDTNYTIAVVALVFILIMLISTCFHFYIFSKHSDELLSWKNKTDTENRVTEATSTSQARTNVTNQVSAPDVSTQRQIQQLQAQTQHLQRQIQNLQPHSGPTAPPMLSDPVYPPNSAMFYPPVPMGSTQDLPPSYESVMYGSGANQASINNFPGPSTTDTSSTTQVPTHSSWNRTTDAYPQQTRNETLRKMVQDRERRKEEDKKKQQRERRQNIVSNMFRK